MGCKAFPSRAVAPQAAVGHMPFVGHRTCGTVRLQQEIRHQARKAMEFGFDPESLKREAHGG